MKLTKLPGSPTSMDFRPGPDGAGVLITRNTSGFAESFRIPIDAPSGTRRSFPGPIRTFSFPTVNIPSPRTT